MTELSGRENEKASEGERRAVASPPPLVLIAGRMTTPVAWRHQTDFFTDREVITPDWHYGLPSMRAMAEEIATRLPERFDLVGWSMGGYIVFELYPLVRDRVRRLGLISTTARAEEPESAATRRRVLAEAERNGMPFAWRQSQIKLAIASATVDPDLQSSLADAFLDLGLDVLRKQTEAIIERRDTREHLKDITCPTIVITGMEDTIIPVDRSEEIASMLPDAELHILQRAGHCSPYETPDAFNALMQRFFR